MLYLDWRFHPVADSLDRTTAFVGSYDMGLVAVSLIVATLAAFVVFSVSERILAANSYLTGWLWSGAGAIIMGGGIWSMHFVGMLAFSLPCGVGYRPLGTFLSMIPGVLASGVALHLITHRSELSFRRLITSAVLMGGGIGLMHYSGMAAMEAEAILRYDPFLVVFSIVVAVALAFISLGIRFRLHASRYSRLMATAIAAPIMGLAVTGMHYTAMEAALFFPTKNHAGFSNPSSPILLAAFVTIVVVLIMITALVATFAGRQAELARRLALEIAERRSTEEELVKARQQAESANEAKTHFFATMSHELRTPLNAIIGFSELMGKQVLGPIDNPKYRSYIADIHLSSMHLLNLINDILDISKAEAGKLEIDEAIIDLNDLIRTILRVSTPSFEKAELNVSADIPPDLPHLRADERQMRQVFFNLIGNAAKFTPPGGRVEIMAHVGSANEFIIRVRDTGIGIAAEDVKRVFEPFVQLGSALSRKHKGTGLGLPTAKRIVELHGGSLDLQSTLGEGTTVRITLPSERTVQRGIDTKLVGGAVTSGLETPALAGSLAN